MVATNNRQTWNELSLVWGVDAALYEGDSHLDGFAKRLMDDAKAAGKLASGEQVVVFHGRTPDQETLKLVGIREVR